MAKENHPNWAELLSEPQKFIALMRDPHTDLMLGTGDIHAIAHLLDKKRRTVMSDGEGIPRPRNKKHYVTQRLGPLGEIYLAAQAMGLPMPQEYLARSRKQAKRADHLWQTIEHSAAKLWEISEADIKLLCSRIGASNVFDSRRWAGHEAHALAIMETFHPSLRLAMAKEAAILQGSPSNSTGWQQRIGKSAGWQR